ncbi:MAG: universal stress protein [Odoribacter sp.]
MDKEQNVQHFLDLIKRSRRGKFKIYIGMIAGVGKTYRMLQEAHELMKNGVDVRIGYVESHNRVNTQALLEGLPIIARRKVFYKGKELEEMDLQAILHLHPEIVIVDELAHTNIEGSKNEKRWQDVFDLLDAGINVISAVNIQHIEGLNEEVKDIAGIEVRERVPDSVLEQADEVVNIDLTAEELVARLKAGLIYKPEKIQIALDNFFKSEHILQLRELALKEVALRVEKKVENEMAENIGIRHEKFLACISSAEKTPRRVIRKTARLATRYNSKFAVLYVQTSKESPDRISLANQRYLINHFKLATDLRGEVIQVRSDHIADSIIEVCRERQISMVCMGKPDFSWYSLFFSIWSYRKLVNSLARLNIDLIILAQK